MVCPLLNLGRDCQRYSIDVRIAMLDVIVQEHELYSLTHCDMLLWTYGGRAY